MQAVQGAESEVKAFTFVTGDPSVRRAAVGRADARSDAASARSCAGSTPRDVPALAESVQAAQDEPFGGLPTLAYARLFERAAPKRRDRAAGRPGDGRAVGGYDYYRAALGGRRPRRPGHDGSPVRARSA